MNENKVLEFIKEYELKDSDFELSGQPKITSLFSMIAGSTFEHGELFDFSEKKLLAQNLTWMVSQAKIEVSPEICNVKKFVLHTWPREILGLFSCRDTEIFDQDNNSLVRATSAWIVADFKLRKPCRLPKSVNEFFHNDGFKKVIECDFKHLKLDFENKETIKKRYKPRPEEIDFNNHVTAAVYFDWNQKCLDEQFRKDHILVEAKSYFQNEILPSHEVVCESYLETKVDGIYSYHQIFHQSIETNHKIINFQMECKWMKK